MRRVHGLSFVVASFLALGCVDVPDIDDPLTFACEVADDCLEDFECGSTGFCQPLPGAGCTSEASTTCMAEDQNLWWVDGCGTAYALQLICESCCEGDGATAACVSCTQ